MTRYFVFFVLLLGTGSCLDAQDPQRFRAEVDALLVRAEKYDAEDLILFTGSSSIRMWRDLHKRFQGKNIVNHGFGGSQMSDLLFYIDELILRHHPAKVFIYEGDNDINAGKSTEEIMDHTKQVLTRIRSDLPDIPVYFIAAKPSVSRWFLKEKYEQFNQTLRAWTEEQADTHFIDVWTPMLQDGEVRRELFKQDSLHMNKMGYDIWMEVISPWVK